MAQTTMSAMRNYQTAVVKFREAKTKVSQLHEQLLEAQRELSQAEAGYNKSREALLNTVEANGTK